MGNFRLVSSISGCFRMVLSGLLVVLDRFGWFPAGCRWLRVVSDGFVYFIVLVSLHEKCPNTELFLVRIFLYSVRIQENTD